MKNNKKITAMLALLLFVAQVIACGTTSTVGDDSFVPDTSSEDTTAAVDELAPPGFAGKGLRWV